jgi:hypothetical protein
MKRRNFPNRGDVLRGSVPARCGTCPHSWILHYAQPCLGAGRRSPPCLPPRVAPNTRHVSQQGGLWRAPNGIPPLTTADPPGDRISNRQRPFQTLKGTGDSTPSIVFICNTSTSRQRFPRPDRWRQIGFAFQAKADAAASCITDNTLSTLHGFAEQSLSLSPPNISDRCNPPKCTGRAITLVSSSSASVLPPKQEQGYNKVYEQQREEKKVK